MTLYPLLILIALIIGVGAICILIFSWIFARFWCKPKHVPPKKTPEHYGLPYKPIKFFSHGVELSGWFIPSNSSNNHKPVIIIPHGWSSNSAKMLPLAAEMHKANYNIFLYDSRGHDASGDDGPITIVKFAEDISSCINYLETHPNIDNGQLGIIGHSLSASSVILAASKDRRIKAIVSCSAFADPFDLTRTTMKRFHIPSSIFAPLVIRFIEHWLKTSMNNVVPWKHINSIHAPVLLLHGDADEYVSISNLDILYDNANPKYRERRIIPNCHHFDILNDSQFHQYVIDFFNEKLLSQSI